jgi:hypothetical protein
MGTCKAHHREAQGVKKTTSQRHASVITCPVRVNTIMHIRGKAYGTKMGEGGLSMKASVCVSISISIGLSFISSKKFCLCKVFKQQSERKNKLISSS